MYSFIDDNFVSRCLRTAFPNFSIRIKNYEIFENDGKWVGIPTLLVHYEFAQDEGTTTIRTKSFIVKVPFCTSISNVRATVNMFTKEQFLYENVLPIIDALYEQPIAPKHYFTAHDQILILEDLRESGFDVKSSATRYDNVEEIVLIMRTLAKFHAASYKLRNEYSTTIRDKLNETIFNHQAVIRRAKSLGELFIRVLRLENVSEESISKFSHFMERIAENTYASLNGDNFEFTTLNHGGLKNDNILMKYNADGVPIDCRFIDFQTYRWSSPATDLVWIWVTAIDFKLFFDHRETMIDVYLESLHRYLTIFGCPVQYTKDQFELDVSKITEYWFSALMWYMYWDKDSSLRTTNGNTYNYETAADAATTVRKDERVRNLFFNWFGYFQKIGLF